MRRAKKVSVTLRIPKGIYDEAQQSRKEHCKCVSFNNFIVSAVGLHIEALKRAEIDRQFIAGSTN